MGDGGGGAQPNDLDKNYLQIINILFGRGGGVMNMGLPMTPIPMSQCNFIIFFSIFTCSGKSGQPIT